MSQEERWVEIATGVEIKAVKNEDGLWSCDAGKTWHGTLMDAYERSKLDGNLTIKGDPNSGQDAFAAWTIAFLQELQALDPGASIKVTRLGNEFVVTREKAVLPPLRASDLRELDLRLEGEGG